MAGAPPAREPNPEFNAVLSPVADPKCARCVPMPWSTIEFLDLFFGREPHTLIAIRDGKITAKTFLPGADGTAIWIRDHNERGGADIYFQINSSSRRDR